MNIWISSQPAEKAFTEPITAPTRSSVTRQYKSSREIVIIAIEILEIIFFVISWNFIGQSPTDVREIFVEKIRLLYDHQ